MPSAPLWLRLSLEMASTRRGSACCPKIVAIATSRAVRSSWRGAYQQTLGLAFSGRTGPHRHRANHATLDDVDRARQRAERRCATSLTLEEGQGSRLLDWSGSLQVSSQWPTSGLG